MELWLPTGNKAQTEIDIEISYLGKKINFINRMMDAYRNDLDGYKKELSACELSIKHNREGSHAIRLKSYSQLQNSCGILKVQVSKLATHVENLEKERDQYLAIIKELELKRKKEATSILEFKHEKAR